MEFCVPAFDVVGFTVNAIDCGGSLWQPEVPNQGN